MQRSDTMYAVIATGGKQYRVREGDSLRVERLDAEEGAGIELDRVLLVGDGDRVTIGRPFVEGGRVAATVKGHGRHRKIKVVKFKRRKNYLRQHGHRQHFTELEIGPITAGLPESASPADEDVSPAGEGASPVDEGVSPAGEGATPVDEGVSPAGEGVSPADEAGV